MIIKSLKLIGFGKFKNKDIELENGINIIYAENEGGKTTIHNFIDGMFYGFLKPGSRQRNYLEEHSKYKPWNGGRYAGILSLEKDDTIYRIEREFTKNKESTKVIVENTGEDISNNVATGANSKVLQPGYHFFGFNSVVYDNTVSIKQMSSKTDDKLATEVRDKLINIGSSRDDRISVENAINDLNKQQDKIGSMTRPTSRYRILSDTINSLKQEREEILKLKEEYDNILDKFNAFKQKEEDLASQLESGKKQLGRVLYQEKKALYKEAINLKDVIDSLKTRLDEYSSYKSLSNDDYSKGMTISNNINVLSSKIEEVNIQAKELEENVVKLSENLNDENDASTDEISKDYLLFDSLEEEKNKLLFSNESSTIEFARRDYEKTQYLKTRYSMGLLCMVTVYLLGMIYFISSGDIKNSLLIQVAIIPIIFVFLHMRKISSQLQETEKKLNELYSVEKNKKTNIEEIDLKQKNILEKYSVNTKLELKSLYEAKKHESLIKSDKINSLNENKTKLNILKNKIGEITKSKLSLTNQLEQILESNCCKDLKEFELGLRNKNIYDETIIEYNSKKELLNKILGNYSIEQLKTEIDDEDGDLSTSLGMTKENIQALIDGYTKELNDIKLELKGYDERINILTPRISKLVDIEEDIKRKTDEFKILDKKKNALELAISTIEKLSKEIQNQFAPEINVKVGEIIKRITNDKYSGVRIDNKLGIGVINPESGEIIDINYLSGGTIDQLYFSLRFGIINSITDDNLPLILDDCFIQYDDIRLENLLNYLYDISKDRQIILFSCHNREKLLLEKMNMDFNLNTLS
jgi:uncharacterized protein YhaN